VEEKLKRYEARFEEMKSTMEVKTRQVILNLDSFYKGRGSQLGGVLNLLVYISSVTLTQIWHFLRQFRTYPTTTTQCAVPKVINRCSRMIENVPVPSWGKSFVV
jgi:hypothetical protein